MCRHGDGGKQLPEDPVYKRGNVTPVRMNLCLTMTPLLVAAAVGGRQAQEHSEDGLWRRESADGVLENHPGVESSHLSYEWDELRIAYYVLAAHAGQI